MPIKKPKINKGFHGEGQEIKTSRLCANHSFRNVGKWASDKSCWKKMWCMRLAGLSPRFDRGLKIFGRRLRHSLPAPMFDFATDIAYSACT